MPKAGYKKSEAEKAHNRLYMKTYSRRNPQSPLHNRMWKLLHRYGIHPREWEILFDLQGKRCAICRTDSHGSRGWNTDHDHKTGKVRGILCWECNNGLGKFKDAPDTLRSAADYLQEQGRCLT